jgi:hypothetical protein
MPTLRTSALTLVYSAAEYASPVWLNIVRIVARSMFNLIILCVLSLVLSNRLRQNGSQSYATFYHHTSGVKKLHAENSQNIYQIHPFHYIKTRQTRILG